MFSTLANITFETEQWVTLSQPVEAAFLLGQCNSLIGSLTIPAVSYPGTGEKLLYAACQPKTLGFISNQAERTADVFKSVARDVVFGAP
jgi:hypothetical protein